jgi:hypothetical protein
MKQDCPSLIVEKTQFPLHLFLLLICHGVKIAFDRSGSFYFWVSAVFCDMSHFLAVVTSRWWASGCGFIHIHCIFILYFDCYCLGRTWSCSSILGFEFPFKGKFLFSVVLFRFSVCSFQFSWSCSSILGFEFPFKGKFLFSVVLFRFSVCSFQF